MTPKDERILRREQEIERGRLMVEWAARQDTFDRWRRAGKIAYFRDADGPEVRVYVEDTLVLRTAGNRDFPTERDVAQVGLAIKALLNFDGVTLADPPPRPKTAQALHVQETARRLREQEARDGKN